MASHRNHLKCICSVAWSHSYARPSTSIPKHQRGAFVTTLGVMRRLRPSLTNQLNELRITPDDSDLKPSASKISSLCPDACLSRATPTTFLTCNREYRLIGVHQSRSLNGCQSNFDYSISLRLIQLKPVDKPQTSFSHSCVVGFYRLFESS